MINKNELRIGNLVYSRSRTSNDGIDKVQSIEWDGINGWQDMGASGCAKFSEITAIPLTEEILLKCGFKVVSPTCEGYNDQSYSRWENTIQIVLKDGYFNLWIDSEDEFYSFAWVKITSLHQLQNLYYALTGEELTVNL